MEQPRLPLLDREVVYVKAKLGDQSESGADSNYLKFAIDPSIITFETLHTILSKLFELQSDFSVNYRAVDDSGEEFELPIQSDWDLDAAIFTSSVPALRVQVDLKKDSNESSDLKDWDLLTADDTSGFKTHAFGLSNQLMSSLQQQPWTNTAKRLTTQTSSLLSTFSQRLGKTVANVQRAMGIKGELDTEINQYFKRPMTDNEFRQYLDGVGRMKRIKEFLWHCYSAGLEPSVRKVGWRFLLAICPPNSTGQERISLLESRTHQYSQLKTNWKEAYSAGRLSDRQLATLIAVAIDVVRTDWTNEYYVGEKNRARVCQLFDLLVTFSLYHPSIGYNQGMSDLASPLLVIQGEEAPAYVCFCSLMHRLRTNFCCSSQKGLLIKVQHLHDLVAYMDPELARFLRSRQLADMYFTQRWLLLELKREFTFEECANIFEVQWAAVLLVAILSQQSTGENSWSDVHLTESSASPAYFFPVNSDHSASTGGPYYANYTIRDLVLINSLLSPNYAVHQPTGRIVDQPQAAVVSSVTVENYLPTEGPPSTSLNDNHPSQLSPNSNTEPYEHIRLKDFVSRLPPPEELGNGNPLLLFLCLSLLQEYRDCLLTTVKEAGDLITFYQRHRRRHNMPRILARARAQFNRYLATRSWLPPSTL